MSLQVTKAKGIPIKVHFTLIITFVLFAWTISNYFMPEYQEGLTQIQYWTMGITATIILFVSITLHEFAHSLVCLRFNIPVRSITLFIFGGVSDMTKEPRDFSQEFKIAAAGPATSYVISGIFAALLGISHFMISENLLGFVEPVLYYSFLLNLLLGTFNLIPAFPLDGGRILRAGLVRWKKDYAHATKIATNTGIGISYVFMGIGFLALISGNVIGGLWIILIGWFLNSGAQAYKYQFEITHALKGVKTEQIMKKDIITVEKNTDLQTVYEDYFRNYLKSEFPVVDKNGNLVGSITSKTIKDTKLEELSDPVADHMTPKKDLVVVSPQTGADKVLLEIVKKNKGRAFVKNKSDKLLGLISKTDIINLANERQEHLRDLKDIRLTSVGKKRRFDT